MPTKSSRRRREGRRVVENLEGRRLLSTGMVATLRAPVLVSAEIGRKHDLDGNGVVSRANASIVGQTAPGAMVRLDRGGDGSVERTTRADASGRYAFPVTLAPGRTPFLVEAGDGPGSSAKVGLIATRGDAVVAWNQTLLNAVRTDLTAPPQAARGMAMVHLAIYDAVNAAAGGGKAYHFEGEALPGTSPSAAASQAAYRVLTSLYPKQAATFDLALRESMAAVPAGRGRRLGLRLGDAAGLDMIALRANDGAAAAAVAYAPGTKAGDWLPTLPRFLPGLAPQWPNVTPFVMKSGSQFRPSPPPPLSSAEYAAAYNEVKAVGGQVSTVRTADQTALARFWADVPGATFTPPGHWNQIAQDASLKKALGLVRNARLFAILDAALADAGICSWDAKYAYNFWRPVTAIRLGDADGNPETTADPTWTSLWATPNFPAYTSGHSTFSGAAQVALESVFGESFSFSDAGDPSLRLEARRFESFEQAAEEAGMSRIYGGIHYQFDNTEGLKGGRAVARLVLDRFPR